MKRFILYLAAVVLTVYMAILYKSQILTALAAIEILIPVPLIILAAVITRMLRVDVSVPVSAVGRDGAVKVALTVENKSFFPVVYSVAEIVCWNQFRQIKSSKKILIQASGRSRAEFLCEWSSQHCGNLIFEVTDLKVHDYIHMIVFRKKIRKSVTAAVLPVPYQVELPPENRNMIPEGGEKFDKFRSGDDPSEVFDIREYRPGDRLSRIHWKMTAKEEEPMVKEYSRPLSGEGILFLDLYSPQADGTWQNADEYLDLLFSLCLSFLEADRSCRAVWKEEKGEEMRSQSIEDEASIYELLGNLFQTCPYKTEYLMEERYREQYPAAKPAFQYRLDLEGKLWEGGKLLWESGRIAPYN